MSDAIDAFIDALWLEEGLSRNTLAAYRRDLGLYVLVQGCKKRFLRQHFEKTSGNLYDGGFLKDVEGVMKGEDKDAIEEKVKALAAAFADPGDVVVDVGVGQGPLEHRVAA